MPRSLVVSGTTYNVADGTVGEYTGWDQVTLWMVAVTNFLSGNLVTVAGANTFTNNNIFTQLLTAQGGISQLSQYTTGFTGTDTLTSTSKRIRIYNPTAGTGIVKMPNATTLSAGDCWFIENQSTAYPIAVQNTGGSVITDPINSVTTAACYGRLAMVLTDNSTANGTWYVAKTLSAAQNLADIGSASTALANLGGAAKASNLSDLSSIPTARTNLFLQGTTSTPAGASTTVISATSQRSQVATPSGNCTFKLDSSFAVGDIVEIVNQSTTYTITIQANDNATITTLFDSQIRLECISASPYGVSGWRTVSRYWSPMHFRASGTPSTATGTNPVNVKYSTVADDTHSIYSTANGTITIPKNGYFQFNMTINASAGNSVLSISGTSVTADATKQICWTSSGGVGSGGLVAKLAAGTYYLVYSAASPTYSAGATFEMMCVGEY